MFKATVVHCATTIPRGIIDKNDFDNGPMNISNSGNSGNSGNVNDSSNPDSESHGKPWQTAFNQNQHHHHHHHHHHQQNQNQNHSTSNQNQNHDYGNENKNENEKEKESFFTKFGSAARSFGFFNSKNHDDDDDDAVVQASLNEEKKNHFRTVKNFIHKPFSLLSQYFIAKVKYLGTNPVTQGSLAFLTTQLALDAFKYILAEAFHWIYRCCTMTVEFDSRDDAHRWMVQWISDQPESQTASVFTVYTSLFRFGRSRLSEISGDEDLQSKVRLYVVPSPDFQMLRYNCKFIWVKRTRQAATADSRENSLERLSVTILGRSCYRRDILLDLIQTARKHYISQDQTRTSVFMSNEHGDWSKNTTRPIRPITSVVLPQGIINHTLNDANDFLSTEKWYIDRGIPYRRGYLFHGPPGTGKTSLVTAVAGALRLNIYVLNMSSPSLTDDSLLTLMRAAPSRCILLLEDVDAAFLQRTSVGEVRNNVTFSGFLNCIDGVASQEGRILVMTTNHPEMLDPALVRPGRVDMKIKFNYAIKEQAIRLFANFYPEHDQQHPHAALEFANALNLPDSFDPHFHNHHHSVDPAAGVGIDHKQEKNNNDTLHNHELITTAEIGGFLMRFKNSPKDAIIQAKNIKSLLLIN